MDFPSFFKNFVAGQDQGQGQGQDHEKVRRRSAPLQLQMVLALTLTLVLTGNEIFEKNQKINFSRIPPLRISPLSGADCYYCCYHLIG